MRRRAFLLLGTATLATAGCRSFAVEAALKQPSELTTTGAVWAPFASSPAAPRRAGIPTLPPTLPGELPHEIERLELPYALPD